MTHEIIRHLLDDYVTGDLDPEASAAVRDHAAGCAICSAELEGLRRVSSGAAQLPKSIEPPADVWSNIRSAILREENAPQRRGVSANELIRRRPFATAIAAAAIIAVLSSAGTLAYVNSRVSSSERLAVTRPNDASAPATLAAFTIEENNYLRTASTLQDVLDQQEGVLAPETVAQLKASLRTIDEAILEGRGALARDPANKLLIEMLSASYRQKVDLLRRSTEMTRGS
jgi:anti-sigma-K factor RskA